MRPTVCTGADGFFNAQRVSSIRQRTVDGSTSECCANACIGRQRHARNKSPWIVESEKRYALRIKERPGRVVVLIEKILHKGKHFQVLVDLVGAMQVDH